MNQSQNKQESQDFLELESLIANQRLRKPSPFLDQRIHAINRPAAKAKRLRWAILTSAAAASIAITLFIQFAPQNQLPHNSQIKPVYANAVVESNQTFSQQTDHGVVRLNHRQFRLINQTTQEIVHIQDKKNKAKTTLEIRRDQQIYVPVEYN